MKKLFVFFVACELASLAFASPSEARTCESGKMACESRHSEADVVDCDSVNIPVFLVDGVEVLSVDSIPQGDIEKIEIVKDPNITRYFRPRLGGLVLITTKSKKYLNPILVRYKNRSEQEAAKRVPGELRIR